MPLCRHTRRLQIVWRPAASWIAPPAVRWIRRLQLLHEGQRCAEPLILDDRAGRHRLDLVEHPERQGDTVVPDSEAPVLRDNQNLCSATISDTSMSSRAFPE